MKNYKYFFASCTLSAIVLLNVCTLCGAKAGKVNYPQKDESDLAITLARHVEESVPACFNIDGDIVGRAGDVESRPQSVFKGVSFERKNGSNCLCSFVEAKCEIDDPVYGNGDCNELLINGVDAAANGYPDVQVKHTLRLCNYNQDDNIIQLVEPPKQAKLEFFHPLPRNEEPLKRFFVDQSFNNRELKAGECEEVIGTKTVSTRRSKYFMKAILQGVQKTSAGEQIQGGFCYAFSYNKIDFEYDYGLGDCNVSTSLSCEIADGSGRDCKKFIDGLGGRCVNFEAVFTASACNNMDRDIELQQKASNYKINTYERKADGKYVRIKELLPSTLEANTCETFTTRKVVDPCERNFWQINVKGSLYNANAENGWVYKDKKCASFAFDSLPGPTADVSPTS